MVFNDDTFGITDEKDFSYYAPYEVQMPSDQCKLLELWDELGVPYKAKKQVFGVPLVIIGISIDPNDMMMTLPIDAKTDLINKMKQFAESLRGKLRYFTKQGWQRLAG